jgi:hypothetical protein
VIEDELIADYSGASRVCINFNFPNLEKTGVISCLPSSTTSTMWKKSRKERTYDENSDYDFCFFHVFLLGA